MINIAIDFDEIFAKIYNEYCSTHPTSIQGRMSGVILDINDANWKMHFEFDEEGSWVWEKFKFNVSCYPDGLIPEDYQYDYDTDYDLSKCKTTLDEINNSTLWDKELNWIKKWLLDNPLPHWSEYDIQELQVALESARPIVPIGVINGCTMEIYDDKYRESPWFTNWEANAGEYYEGQQRLAYFRIVEWLYHNPMLLSSDGQALNVDITDAFREINIIKEKDLYYFSLRDLARDEKTTSSKLEVLINVNKDNYSRDDESANIRYVNLCIDIAKHNNTTERRLEKLALDNNEQIRSAAVNNKNISISLLEKLCKSKEEDVRITSMGSRFLTDELMEKYSNDSDASIRLEVAKNTNTKVKLLDKLLSDEHPSVRTAAASNPNLTTNFLNNLVNRPDLNDEVLHDIENSILTGIAKNKNTSTILLEKIFGEDKNGCREAIVQNPSAAPALLRQIHEEYINNPYRNDYVFIDPFLARNPNTPKDILREFRHVGSSQTYVAENKNTPLDILEKLKGSVRSEVSENALENIYLRTQNDTNLHS